VLPSRLAALALLSLTPAFARALEEPSEIRAYLARLAERGLSAEVVREGESYLRTHAGSPEADVVRYRVGCARIALGQDAEGLRLLGPLARRAGFEFAAESAVRAAEVALRAGDAALAEDLLEPALGGARGATRDAVRVLLARARLAGGRHDAARDDARALRRETGDPGLRREALLVEAWAELRAGRAAQAGDLARELLSDRAATAHEQGEARVLAGEALLDVGQPAAALDAFRAVGEGPWHGAGRRGAAFALAALGRHAEAATAFADALRAEPAGAHALECALHAGIELFAASDIGGARAAFANPALDAHADAAEWRARAALADGDAEAALAALDRAPPPGTDDPDRARRRARLRGEILEKAGRGSEAARAYAASGAPGGLLEAARASLAAGDARAARGHARDLLEARPEPALALPAHIALGEAAFRLESWGEARSAFDAAAALEPDRERAARIRLRAAWSAWSGGDHADAGRRARDAAGDLGGDDHEEAAFLAARALESAGDPTAASAWRAYLERHPAGARAGEAVLHLARSVPTAEARALLVGALGREREARRAAPVAFELGELEARAKDHAAARAAYERALASGAGPLEPAARYGLAYACAALGDDAAADAALAPLLASPDREDALVRAGLELAVALRVRAGDAAGALARWAELERAAGPADRALGCLRPAIPLLVAAGRAPDADGALALLARRARGRDAGAVEVERAWLALDTHDLAGATRAVERAGRSDAEPALLAEARLGLGDALARAGDGPGARAQFAAAADAAGARDRALVRLAWSRLGDGEDAAALADLERFERECAASPERPRALALRGEALHRLGRHADCARVLSEARALVRDPDTRAIVLERLGTALSRTGSWREAADVLAEFAREFPRAPGLAAAELERGRALARLGDARGARTCLERALASGGAIAARARVERARLALAAGDADAALSDALKAALLVDDPESTPEALMLAAEILERQGEGAAARARLAELVERHPRSPAGVRAREILDARGGAAPNPERTTRGERR